MSNPSTVWTQLSLPISPIGSIPYVDVDGATINTDVNNFYYTSAAILALGLSGSSAFAGQITAYGGLRQKYIDTSGTPGSTTTINAPAGRFAFPGGNISSAVVVTNSFCTPTSIIVCQLETSDNTLTRVIAVPSTGSFTVAGNTTATYVTKCSFVIHNVY